MRRTIAHFSLLLLLIGCIDQVQVPVRDEEPRLVVEGQLTNEAPPYTVRLSYTGNVSGPNSASQYVEDAQVSLSDDRGQTTALKRIRSGVYQTTDLTFRGQTGRAYQLVVRLADGRQYVSIPERMPQGVEMDSLYAANLIQTEKGLAHFFIGFRTTTKDPAELGNYYRWLVRAYTSINCGDYSWTPVRTDAVNILSDSHINGNSFQRTVVDVSIYSTGPQLVEAKQLAITQSAYAFWQLYQQQNARTGSIFDPLPASVVGNVVNVSNPTDRARGLFEVCSVTVKRLRYYDQKWVYLPNVQSFITAQQQSRIICANLPPGGYPLYLSPPGF